MPKTDIDYSNTIIYKITCTNPEIKDVYVGHTTNFVQRKHCHKQGCNNIKSSNYNCKLYKTMREKGGWDNWKMEIIDFFNCSNQYEARQKEQEYFISLNANLNSVEPIKPDKISNHEIQIDTTQVNDNPIICKSKFICKSCDFNCNKKRDYNRHLITLKHKRLSNESIFKCKCNKLFKTHSGLWKHQKKCTFEKFKKIEKNVQPEDITNIINTTDSNFILINQLLKQNDEFKNILLEQKTVFLEALKANLLNNDAEKVH